MHSHPLATRSSLEEIIEARTRFQQAHPLAAVMDAVPSILLFLNEHRQVVFANKPALEALSNGDMNALLGRRPGEILDCVHVDEGAHGCGSSEACRVCGAAKALRSCEQGQDSVEECWIRKRSGVSLDLRVSTSAVECDGERFIVLSVTDVSHENRRRNLERIFFHDVMNTLGGLIGYAQLLDESDGSDSRELGSSILRLANSLAEEIAAQRDLAAAEANDLAVRPEVINSRTLIDHLVSEYRSHPANAGRQIEIASAESAQLRSDRRLLQRVLSNMLKNAVEASTMSGCVSLSCAVSDGQVVFSVHNTSVMARNVQLQVFSRAFSTKQVGRGLGTYSMKLLGEKYLGGKVWFTSAEGAGTTFNLSVPLNL